MLQCVRFRGGIQTIVMQQRRMWEPGLSRLSKTGTTVEGFCRLVLGQFSSKRAARGAASSSGKSRMLQEFPPISQQAKPGLIVPRMPVAGLRSRVASGSGPRGRAKAPSTTWISRVFLISWMRSCPSGRAARRVRMRTPAHGLHEDSTQSAPEACSAVSPRPDQRTPSVLTRRVESGQAASSGVSPNGTENAQRLE